jgi:dienelactone hydrolase
MKISGLFIVALFAGLSFTACNNNTEKEKVKTPMIKEQNISYSVDTPALNGFMAYDSSITGKRPVVLVIHEWWGLNENTKNKVRQLAALGYLAFAVDMYGDGRMGNDPDAAKNLAMPFYQNPALAKSRFDAALAKVKTFDQADTTKIAATGYCFGGGMVLNLARLGENLKGVVSFHGSLVGVPADKSLLKAKILVCHGADDQFVKPEEVAMFKKQMDSIGADYTFIAYPGATHAFTNPNATKMGVQFKMPIAYNAAADSSSWQAMQTFFARIFK